MKKAKKLGLLAVVFVAAMAYKPLDSAASCYGAVICGREYTRCTSNPYCDTLNCLEQCEATYNNCMCYSCGVCDPGLTQGTLPGIESDFLGSAAVKEKNFCAAVDGGQDASVRSSGEKR